jgi:putative sigma-54 modulation protein
MRIHVTSRHARLTPTVRRSIEERLKKSARFAALTEVHVILDVQKLRHVAEIVAHADNREIVVREESADVRTSIEAAIVRLESRLKRVREKRSTRRLHDGTRPNGDEAVGAIRSAARAALPAASPKIVPSRGAGAKPLSVDEAAERLLADGAEYLAFVNVETGRVNVLHRRKDGDLGLIAPREAAARRGRG